MSCSALNAKLCHCRNWSMVNSDYCYTHRNYTEDLYKQRWFQKYILGKDRYPIYFHNTTKHRTSILRDLKSGRIQLTQEDLQKIPVKFSYVDVYILLLQNGFAKYGDHPRLEWIALWLFANIMRNFPDNAHMFGIKTLIEEHLILSSGKAFYTFLYFVAGTSKGRGTFAQKMVTMIPTLLDSDAAKELSWFPRDELDKLRITYEKELGGKHPLTKCLVQRWLLDLKELYQTEKAIQKLKMDQCKEELMMNRWHPDRVEKFLLAGIDIDDM